MYTRRVVRTTSRTSGWNARAAPSGAKCRVGWKFTRTRASSAACSKTLHVRFPRRSGETTRKAEESAAEKLEKLREQEEDAKRLKKEEKKQKKLEKKKQEEEEEEEDEEEGGEPEMDPEMAAIMGFGSFGGGTKKK